MAETTTSTTESVAQVIAESSKFLSSWQPLLSLLDKGSLFFHENNKITTNPFSSTLQFLTLQGPPKSGKWSLVSLLARHVNADVVVVDLLTSLLNAAVIIQDTKQQLDLEIKFNNAKQKSCILLLENMDQVLQSSVDPSLQIATLNALTRSCDEIRGLPMVLIATTSNASLWPKALKSDKYFSRVIDVGSLELEGREYVFNTVFHDLCQDDILFNTLIQRTAGYTLGDVHLLIKRLLWYNTSSDERMSLHHIQNMIDITPPSIKPTLSAPKPTTTFSALGGYDSIKERVFQTVQRSLLNSQVYERLGLKPPSGLLLYGPSGCGKTALAEALCNELPVNYLTAKYTDIFSKYLGDSESALRSLFDSARQLSPCILFLDELDLLGRRRSTNDNDGASSVSDRVLSTLLNEMDGVVERTGVFVLACTSRPDLVDDALIRPGRMDVLVYVPPPNENDRREIFKCVVKTMSVDPGWNLEEYVVKTKDWTPADIKSLLRDAALLTLRQDPSSMSVSSQAIETTYHIAHARVLRRMGNEHWEAFEKFHKGGFKLSDASHTNRVP